MNAQNWRALQSLGSMHNVYLQWLEEVGIIGAALMFTTIALIFWHILRGLRVRRRMHTWLRAILCISLLVLLHGMVDYGLQVPSIAMTWTLLLGIGFGLATKRQH
jgi:O-antigen ligase